MSPDSFAAALDVLCQKNMDFSVILDSYGFQCNAGIDGGVEQKNGFQFVVLFLQSELCIIAAITSGGRLNESRHPRGNIRSPVIKNNGFQRNPGIGGEEEQKRIAFQFLCIVFRW